MSTYRSTDDRDRDYRRQQALIANQVLILNKTEEILKRLERLEMELLRPPTKTFPGYGYDPRGGE